MVCPSQALCADSESFLRYVTEKRKGVYTVLHVNVYMHVIKFHHWREAVEESIFVMETGLTSHFPSFF